MGAPFRNRLPMSAEEFFAFTETRPDEERWELIDGEPILNPSPTRLHQIILLNLGTLLRHFAKSSGGAWEVLPGIGLRLTGTSVPVPDLIVRPNDDLKGFECSDAIVTFEILSPSTADRDLRWKRKAYARLPTLQHYVVVAQDAVEIFHFDRSARFAERRIERLADSLPLEALGVALPLTEIYEGTRLGD